MTAARLALARRNATRRGLPRRPMHRAALLSAAFHLLLAAAFLLPFILPHHQTTPKPQQMAQIELIQQPTPTVGDGATENGQGADTHAGAPPPSPPAAPPGQHAPAALPQAEHADLPLPGPPPSPPSPPRTDAPPARQASAAAPAVRLGNGGDPGTAIVTGSNVIPASLDSTAHNAPPAYPEAAARRGEEGTVLLRVHVDPDGSPETVDVAESSGYEALDRAAREAVARWHFHPAESDGSGISSDLPVRVRFVLKE